jgi:outer membrane protein insertion porin family
MEMMNSSARIVTFAVWLGLCGAFASSACAESGEFRLHAKQIRIFGNDKTKSYIIERALPFSAGGYFDADMIERARDNIRRIPGIDYSEIRVGYIPYDSSTVVTVIVTEKSALRGNLLFGRGYEDKISIGFKVGNANLRGRSESVEASAMFRGNTIVQTAWKNPWIGGRLHLGIGVRAFYRHYHYVYGDLGGMFEGAEIEATGARLSVSRPAGDRQTVSIEGGIESVTSPVQGVTLDGERDSYGVIAGIFKRDTREGSLFPWSASYVEARAELIGPGDETQSIFEGSVDARKYFPVISRAVFAVQGVYRTRDGDRIPPYRREHVGGSRTLRGYDYGTFNGVNLLAGGAEYRIPFNFSRDEPVEYLLLGVSLHLFAETAAVWEKDESFSSDLLHGSFGLGISFLAPNSTGFRVDYGWHTKSSGRWDVDVGLKF